MVNGQSNRRAGAWLTNYDFLNFFLLFSLNKTVKEAHQVSLDHVLRYVIHVL